MNDLGDDRSTDSTSGRPRSACLSEYSLIVQFFTTAEDGEMEKLKEFMENNAEFDVNKYNHHGQTALHVATAAGRCDVVEYLVSRGADISNLNTKGDHILHTAARMGNHDALRLIKSFGVDLNLKNKDGETAVHLATRSNHLQLLESLCNGGADVNLQDKNGEAAIHVSCWLGLPRSCQLLCNNKSNTNIKNNEGEAPIHFASGRGNTDCLRILIENGADVNIVDKRGSTALHLACRRNHLEVAMALLRAGCHVDVIDQLGETPLHPACHNNLVAVVQTMCAFGCRLDVVNKSGSCPLHVATRTGHIEAVRCLLLSGVPPYQINANGITAEVMAISQGHNEIAELIGGLKDKQVEYIRQLLPNEVGIDRVKMKLFGHSGSGKTGLVESLKCSFIGSLLRKAGLGNSNGESQNAYCRNSIGIVQILQKENQLPKVQPLRYSTHLKVPKKKSKTGKAFVRRVSSESRTENLPDTVNLQYTRGIAVQQTNMPGIGDVSVWEFSGFEPFFVSYDHFIGDPNCLHLVLFKGSDTHEEQLRQICFWMEFIRIRLPRSESIGKRGRAINPCHVLLVATNTNEVKATPSQHRSNMNSLHFDAVTMFSRDFSIYPKIIGVDSSQPMSADMKVLKGVLLEMKNGILQHIPSTTNFFNAAVAALPNWRKNMSFFPVVTWSNFKDYLRLNVNLLACEEHLKNLVYFLQITGEIAFLESSKQDDSLVIIDPKWLGQDLIPAVLDRNIQLLEKHPDGIFTRDHLFLNVFRGSCVDLNGSVEVLEAMDLVSSLEEEHDDVVYEIASLVRLSRPPERELWDPEDIRFLTGKEGGEGVFGGVRLIPFTSTSKNQLRSIFPRIQAKARQHYDSLKAIDHSENEESDDELYSRSDDASLNDLNLWYGGFKCTKGNLEVLVTEERDVKSEWIEIKARGQRETSSELFNFFHETLVVVTSAVESCAPALEFQFQYLSPLQLSEYKDNVDFYLPRNIVIAQKLGKERISKSENLCVDKLSSESLDRVSSEDSGVSSEASTSACLENNNTELLADILVFGSTKAYEKLIPVMDLPIKCISVGMRRRLCALLDPPNPTGQDWCLLSVFVGQSNEIPLIDSSLKEAFSRTDQVLRRWSQSDEKPLLKDLIDKLQRIGRTDAIEVLLNFAPPYQLMESQAEPSLHPEKSSVNDNPSVADSKDVAE